MSQEQGLTPAQAERMARMADESRELIAREYDISSGQVFDRFMEEESHPSTDGWV
jgi:hypothetical protein